MRAIRDKMPLLCEVVNFKKDGSRFVNSLLIVPIFDDLGELIYFLGSQTEVKAISPEEIHAVNSQSNRLASLSKRQREVLSGMIAGRRNKEIACELGISERTVKMHRAAAIAALNVRTSADAISMAVRAGWPDKRSKA
jgi:DNA-binding CsgD family transcriptional regulator